MGNYLCTRGNSEDSQEEKRPLSRPDEWGTGGAKSVELQNQTGFHYKKMGSAVSGKTAVYPTVSDCKGSPHTPLHMMPEEVGGSSQPAALTPKKRPSKQRAKKKEAGVSNQLMSAQEIRGDTHSTEHRVTAETSEMHTHDVTDTPRTVTPPDMVSEEVRGSSKPVAQGQERKKKRPKRRAQKKGTGVKSHLMGAEEIGGDTHNTEHRVTGETSETHTHDVTDTPLEVTTTQIEGQSQHATGDVIVGIDVGTANSGYAYGGGKRIECNSNWAASLGYTAFKAPTAHFTDKNTQHFGFEALEKLAECDDTGGEEDNNRCFLQTLYPDPRDDTETGMTSQLLTNISKYFLQNCEEKLIKTGVTVQKVKAVLLVNKQWDVNLEEVQKNLHQGLVSGEPMVVDAPLADFFSCMHPSQRVNRETPHQVLMISTGGSCITLSLYEHFADDTWVKVKHDITAGSRSINKAFMTDLERVFGREFLMKLSSQIPSAWFSFIDRFEKMKRGAKPDFTAKYTMPLEYVFGAIFREVHDKKLEEHLQTVEDSGFTINKQGNLAIDPDKINRYFDDLLCGVRERLRKYEGTWRPDVVYMAGGMANSPYLLAAVKEELSCQTVVPEDPNMLGARGGVLYGQTTTYDTVAVAASDIYIHTVIQKADHDTPAQGAFTITRSDRNKTFEGVTLVCRKGFVLSPSAELLDHGAMKLSFNDIEEVDSFNLALCVTTTSSEDQLDLNPVDLIPIDASVMKQVITSNNKVPAEWSLERQGQHLYVKVTFTEFSAPQQPEVKCVLSNHFCLPNAIRFK